MSTSTSSNSAGRPSHLVVFHKDKNPAAIRACLNKSMQTVTDSKNRNKRDAATVSAAFHEAVNGLPERQTSDGVTESIFDTIGVAALNLTSEEAGAFRADRDNVRAVLKNRERYVLGVPSRRPGVFFGLSASIAGDPGLTPPRRINSLRDKSSWIGFRDKLDIKNDLPDSNKNLSFLIAYLNNQNSLVQRLIQSPILQVPQSQHAIDAILDTPNLTWGLRAIGIPSESNFTGKGVKVAVLDTGIDLKHPDFLGRIPEDNQKSFIQGVTSVQDGHGHGTHCCGVVAGPQNPSRGPRYGVAPDVDLFVGKVMSDEGSGWDSDILAGIEWVARKWKAAEKPKEGESQTKIISLSLGSARGDGEEDFNRVYETVAVRLAQDEFQVLLVTAAGNESRRSGGVIAPVGNPAACPAFMAVAAVDSTLEVADFSCGQQVSGQIIDVGMVDIAAPGVGIYSSVPSFAGLASGNLYNFMDGTSMAAPHVAGVAALYLQQSPHLSASELWRRLEQNALPLGHHLDYGRGLVQVP